MPTSLGPAEILVILVVALIVLGPERLPKAARQIGKAVAEVRQWSGGIHDEVRRAFDTEPAAEPTPGPDRTTERPTDRATEAPPPPVPPTSGPPGPPAPADPAPGGPDASNLPSSN